MSYEEGTTKRLRAEEIQLLEAAAANEFSQAFKVVQDALDLPPGYRNALLRALQKSNWRRAKEPLRTIRGALLQFAFEFCDPITKAGPLVDFMSISEAHLSEELYRRDTSNAIRDSDGVWRQGRASNPDDEGRNDLDENADLSLLRLTGMSLHDRVKPKFRRRVQDSNISADPIKAVNWRALARAADLDSLETEVLTAYFTSPRGRARMITDASSSAEDTKQILAAWKRVQRKLPKIREILFI